LLIFLSFFLTCGDFEPIETPTDKEKIIYTNVEYYENGITIYLNGPVPVPASRALSKSLAIIGHDFFEITFLYRSTAGEYIVARGTWELGETAGINGVYRTTDRPIDYGKPINTTLADNDTGTAILFAGKKTDKTLLAVGTLSDARDSNGNSQKDGTSIWITHDTMSVSFGLNALKAGSTSTPTPEYPNSFTANSSVPNGEIIVGIRKFPVVGVTKGPAITASYEIRTHSTASGVSFNTTYRPGIILAANPTITDTDPVTVQLNNPFRRVANIEPHYTYPDGNPRNRADWITSSDKDLELYYPWSSVTTVALTNNTGTSGPFLNPINFTLNTSAATDKDILSITFQIPVNALSADNTPVKWFIRPGYDNYLLELDSGRFENGGAMLVSIGTISSNPLYSFRRIADPAKRFYNNYENYNFDLTGSTFQFIRSTGNLVLDSFTDGIHTSGIIVGGTIQFYIDWNNNFETTGTLDSTIYTVPNPGAGNTPPVVYTNGDELIGNISNYVFPRINRYLTIIVRYYDPTMIDGATQYYYSYFKIFVSTLNFNGQIPVANRYVIGSVNDLNVNFTARLNNPAAGSVFLFTFTQSMDIPNLAINCGAVNGVTIIMTATFPNVTIGRNGNNSINITGGTGGNITFFFGKWPMNEPTVVGGLVLDDYEYRINTIGSWQNYGGAATSTTNLIPAVPGVNLTIIKSDEILQHGTLLGN
jgi:hypothetical protein